MSPAPDSEVDPRSIEAHREGRYASGLPFDTKTVSEESAEEPEA